MGYIIICWPESQELMELDGFRENCSLINGERGLDIYGSCAYLVDKDWYDEYVNAPFVKDDDDMDNDEDEDYDDEDYDNEDEDYDDEDYDDEDELQIVYDDDLIELGFLDEEDEYEDDEDEDRDDEEYAE